MATAATLSPAAADVLLQLTGRPSWLHQQEILSRSITGEMTLFSTGLCIHTPKSDTSHCALRVTQSKTDTYTMLERLHLTFPGRQDFSQQMNHSCRAHTLPTQDEGKLDMGSGAGSWMAVVSPGNDALLSPGAIKNMEFSKS